MEILFEKSVDDVVKLFENDKSNDRYLSWEICYTKFCEFKDKTPEDEKQIELLSLHLVGYLASWGMYRGSSALLRDYNYMIHKDLIKILLCEENRKLFILDVIENTEEFLSLIDKVYNEIKEYYLKLENNEGNKMNPSRTLITKILLGVYGCIPAYDRNVISSLKKAGIKYSDFGSLITAIKNNDGFLEQCQKCLKKYPKYTFMKIVDIYLWKIGSELN